MSTVGSTSPWCSTPGREAPARRLGGVRIRERLGQALFERVAGPDGPRHRERIHGTPGPRWFEPGSPITRVHGDASMYVGGHPGGAAPDPAARGDDRRGRALRLPRRHVGPPRAHQQVPRGHHLRHRRRRAAGRRRRARDPRPGHRARCPTARRTPRATRTCSAGCTSPRSRASCSPTGATAPRPLDQAGYDEYVAQAAQIASRLGVVDPPMTEAELHAVVAGFRPELRATDHAREAAAYLIRHPELPHAARPGYWVLVACGDRPHARVGSRDVASPEAARGPRSGRRPARPRRHPHGPMGDGE